MILQLPIDTSTLFYKGKDDYSEIQLNNAGSVTCEIAHIITHKIRVTCATGYTPKTHYSGNRRLFKLKIDIDYDKTVDHFGNFELLKKEFRGGSNIEAEQNAKEAGCIFFTLAKNCSCQGVILLFKERISNQFGTIENKSYCPNYINEVSYPRLADLTDYAAIFIAAGNLMNTDDILFSGWKQPVNLLEKGEFSVEFCNSIHINGSLLNCHVPYAKKIASSQGDQARDIIKDHFEDIFLNS